MRAFLCVLLATSAGVLCVACGPGEESVGEPAPDPATPFAAEMIEFSPGEGAGFGQDRLPDVVLGPPSGGGDGAGSLDVLSLGAQGEIILQLGGDVIDEEGPDLVVFENPFRILGGGVFAELGAVAVSADGEQWEAFPCDADSGLGCAGQAPVYATDAATATDPEQSGGDAFDLADLGLSSARYVRITDVNGRGDGETVGFDLDAVAIYHMR